MRIGEIVYSTAGRDGGRYYAVVELISDDYVKIADGDLRRVRSAKLKKVKHLKSDGDVLERIAEKMVAGVPVFDAELKNALRCYNENKAK